MLGTFVLIATLPGVDFSISGWSKSQIGSEASSLDFPLHKGYFHYGDSDTQRE